MKLLEQYFQTNHVFLPTLHLQINPFPNPFTYPIHPPYQDLSVYVYNVSPPVIKYFIEFDTKHDFLPADTFGVVAPFYTSVRIEPTNQSALFGYRD